VLLAPFGVDLQRTQLGDRVGLGARGKCEACRLAARESPCELERGGAVCAVALPQAGDATVAGVDGRRECAP
jgi:hypothetical protein